MKSNKKMVLPIFCLMCSSCIGKTDYDISNYRKGLFWVLNGVAVDHWKKTLTPEEFSTIRSNFIHRAKMSKAEEANMFR